MTKKLSDSQIRMVVLILLLIAPFILAYAGIAFGMEWQGRFIGLSLAAIGFPLLLVWLALNPKYKESWGFTYNRRRYYRPAQVFGIFFSLFLLMCTRSFIEDFFVVISSGPVSEVGIVSQISHSPYSRVVRGQWIRLEKEPARKFFAAFTTTWMKQGNEVEIMYLPNTRFILESRILSKN